MSAAEMIADLAARARAASQTLARLPTAAKAEGLRAAAGAVRARADAILAANAEDMAGATALSPALRDRLRLDPARLEGIAAGIEAVAGLNDPVKNVLLI